MYIRFVIQTKDNDSGHRQGLFQALAELKQADILKEKDLCKYKEIYNWFRNNLKAPCRFSRSAKPHAKNVAISWFKDMANEHIAKMHSLRQILEDYGISVDVIRTNRPGYIVYEDRHQIAAEPFNDTPT